MTDEPEVDTARELRAIRMELAAIAEGFRQVIGLLRQWDTVYRTRATPEEQSREIHSLRMTASVYDNTRR